MMTEAVVTDFTAAIKGFRSIFINLNLYERTAAVIPDTIARENPASIWKNELKIIFQKLFS